MAFNEQTEELAVKAAQGDQSALNELLRKIEPDVMRHAARFLPCRQDAEEACQDALLQVARNIHRFEGRSRWMNVGCVSVEEVEVVDEAGEGGRGVASCGG